MKLKGYILAAVAAATYGTNPAFAVPLYADGMNPNTVLFFRYLLGLPILASMLLLRGHSLKISRGELMPLGVLGILMGISSLTLFQSYNYMNSGIASTLLFVYPVMVAVLMTFFFHERFRATTALCLVIMTGGLVLLLRAPEGMEVSGTGVVLVMLSSLTYAIYLVMTNVSRAVQSIPTLKLLFWQHRHSVYSGAMCFGLGKSCSFGGVAHSGVTGLHNCGDTLHRLDFHSNFRRT